MKVKKYKAASMPEVMKKVREELGSQAVILQSKTAYTGGIFGLFKKKYIEVVAGIDETEQVSRPEEGTTLRKSGKSEQGKSFSGTDSFSYNRSRAANELLTPERENPTDSTGNGMKQKAPVRPLFPEQNSQGSFPNLTKELSELKKMIFDLNQSSGSNKVYPPMIQRQLNQLRQNGVRQNLLEALGENLLIKWQTEQSSVTKAKIKQWIMHFFKAHLSDKETSNEYPSFVYVLGSTGVGKTTTLAKLASRQVLDRGETVAFVTTDTYRIAAVEQLKTYAALLNAPIEVAYSPEDVATAFEKLKHYNTIYIDTAGRSFLSNHYVEETRSFIQNTEKDAATCYLVLSAAAKEEDNKEVIRNFSTIPLSGLIFTKLDETRTKGTIINLAEEFKLPVRYTTNGQNVPEDLHHANHEQIILSLFEENADE